jgi:hypothetical protein
MKGWVGTHVFRVWTAAAVLAAYVYGWVYFPEALTWWKRTTTDLIEAGCDQLPYPWGDRIEATLGNFGLWVQITMAIIVFRILVWLLMSLLRALSKRRHQEADRPLSLPTEDPTYPPRALGHDREPVRQNVLRRPD